MFSTGINMAKENQKRPSQKKRMLEYSVDDVIKASFNGLRTYCKFLAANDTTQTKSHQAGVLVSKKAEDVLGLSLMKQKLSDKQNVRERFVNIRCYYEDDFEKNTKKKQARFVYYESKHEYRITRIPLIDGNYTGALFVLIKNSIDQYDIFILDKEDDIEEYLDTFNLSALNIILEDDCFVNPNNDLATKEKKEIDEYLKKITDFPSTEEVSNKARDIFKKIYINDEKKEEDIGIANPDKDILNWLNIEYNVFKAIEKKRYGEDLKHGFDSIEEFLTLAKSVLNRRKSRAGKSFENHLNEIFSLNGFINKQDYTYQAKTEKNKTVDFLFPSIELYRDAKKNHSLEKYLVFLAAKTTCKDRWRQILHEAELSKGKRIYLCTLQPDISQKQREQMSDANVKLVIPKAIRKKYDKEFRKEIYSLSDFVKYVRENQKKLKTLG